MTPKSSSIQKKLISSFLVLIFSLTLVFSSVSYYYQNQNLNNQADHEIEVINNIFNSLIKSEVNSLSSALEVIVQDKPLMDCYLEKNRTKLYEKGQPLFQSLKETFNDTHFYFIEPNGTCFVRLHNKDIFGDKITRFTYWNANNTMNVSYGLELGKTAFALRVVKPYYNGSQHIGFIELGKEIDHFFMLMNEQVLGEFAVIVNKQYLNEEKWKSDRVVHELRNNWDDLENYLMLMQTVEENLDLNEPCMSCFVSKNIEEVIKKNHTSTIIKHEDKTFVCGGFPFVDAGNREVGVVFSLIDISKEASISNYANILNIVFAIFLLIITFLITGYIARNFSKPLINLSNNIKKIEEGNLDIEIEIETNDEIGQLSHAFNKMTTSIKENNENLEKKVLERTNQLRGTIKKIEKTEEELRVKNEDLTVTTEELQAMNQELDVTREQLKDMNFNLEEKVKERTLEVQHLIEVKDEFINQLSHDLKTPITPLNTLLPIMQKKINDEKINEMLAVCIDKVKYMKSLVTNTLQLARMNSSSFEIKLSDIRLSDEVNRIVNCGSFNYEANNIQLETLISDDLYVKVDSMRFEELINNLVSNAVKYSPDGGTITLKAEETKDNMIKISIQDTGMGMNKEQADHVFDEFYKADESRHDFTSTGLGLSICKKIIEKHQGKIWVESGGIGKGCTFYFTLKSK